MSIGKNVKNRREECGLDQSELAEKLHNMLLSVKKSGAIKLPDKYGFRLDRNHPKIDKLYERYKRTAEKAAYGLSDAQRRDFEEKTIAFYSRLYKQKFGEDFIYPGLDYQRERINALIDMVEIPE